MKWRLPSFPKIYPPSLIPHFLLQHELREHRPQGNWNQLPNIQMLRESEFAITHDLNKVHVDKTHRNHGNTATIVTLISRVHADNTQCNHGNTATMAT
jgi:hypothetical protein